MESGWRVATSVLAVLGLFVMVGGCGSEESAFDPEQDGSLCSWLTDAEFTASTGRAIEDGGSDEEAFKSPMGGWGCWWQTAGGGVILAPFAESKAHPLPEEVASFPHPALSGDARVVDWPEGDWPPQIDLESGGLDAVLRIEGRSQLLWFSLVTESEVDVDTALSVADEMLNRMGWVD